ncbi:MAG: hypothetical protein K8E24_000045, partial [Methanobacterium paludis]|nr:hypothetical protein [Methanobacterium paludis]
MKKMDPQLKSIVLKEVKEVFKRRDYLFNTLVNILPFLALGFITVMATTGSAQKLIMEFSFIIIPSLAMLLVGFPFIREKFSDEKLVRKFEGILTTPVSLKTVWAGKMVSIFLLSYPTVIIVIIMLLIIWNIFGGLNPIYILSTPVWVMALIITPLVPMIDPEFNGVEIAKPFVKKLLVRKLNPARLLDFIGE